MDGELPAPISQDFVQLGRFPSNVVLPARRSSRRDAAKALCAAAARRPDHRATHADRAAACMAAGAADARWPASNRSIPFEYGVNAGDPHSKGKVVYRG